MQEINSIVQRTKRQIEMERKMRQTPTFQMFHQFVMKTQETTPEWRIGQTWWNCAVEARPGLTDNLHGSDIDPFYDNSQVVAFCEYLSTNWDNWSDEVRDWYKKYDVDWASNNPYKF